MVTIQVMQMAVHHWEVYYKSPFPFFDFTNHASQGIVCGRLLSVHSHQHIPLINLLPVLVQEAGELHEDIMLTEDIIPLCINSEGDSTAYSGHCRTQHT